MRAVLPEAMVSWWSRADGESFLGVTLGLMDGVDGLGAA